MATVKPEMAYPNGNKAPNAVATPFPPLNLKKMGKICPRQAANATKPTVDGGRAKCSASATGNIPFKISHISTPNAAVFPPMRKTLVAPGLFEPCSLGSGKPANLQKVIALENEPSR